MKKKDEIVERVVEINERFVRMVVDEVIDCLEDGKEVLNDRSFDERTLSSLVVEKCSGMPFANEARVRRVIDAMLWDLFREGYIVYPQIAEEFIEEYGIEDGVCLDIGTGPGYLGIEIGKISNLKVYLIDVDPGALEKCRENSKEAEVEDQVIPVKMDVKNLEFSDNFADFVVSRGSIWFWDDRVQGLKEIYRVLKTGGVALVGGGFGKKLPELYRESLAKKVEGMHGENKWRWVQSEDYFKKILAEASINSYKLRFDPPLGRWVEIRKVENGV